MLRRVQGFTFATLLLQGCNDDSSASTADTKTTASGPSETSVGSVPTEAGTADGSNSETGCILGSEGCACVDGLCLGEFECQDSVCVMPVLTDGVSSSSTSAMSTTVATGATTDNTTNQPGGCDGTVNGNVQIMNSTQLEALAGVRIITGSLQIGADIGPTPQLGCLEKAMTILLYSGNDYSAFQNLEDTQALTLHGSPNTIYPSFANLNTIGSISLNFVSDPPPFPSVKELSYLALDTSDAPDFAGNLDFVEYLVLSQGAGEHSTLDGVLVNYLSVHSYMGTSLPMVTLTTNLDIYEAPNLVSVPVDFGDTFPSNFPINADDESNARIYIHGTALSTLDDLAGIATHRSRPRVHMNPQLIDISGFTGASVILDYLLPPNSWGIGITESPSLCTSHAQMIFDTMTLPAPPLLNGLDEQC